MRIELERCDGSSIHMAQPRPGRMTRSRRWSKKRLDAWRSDHMFVAAAFHPMICQSLHGLHWNVCPCTFVITARGFSTIDSHLEVFYEGERDDNSLYLDDV